MLLCLLVTAQDKHLIEPLVRAFTLSNPGAGHSLLACASANDSELAAEITSKLGHHFAATGHFIYPSTPLQGWPLAPNFAFQSIVHYVRTIIAPTEGWMLMEMDCTPLQHGWLDAIQSEYYADYNRPIQKYPGHRAFMGAKTRTYATRNGEVAPVDVTGYHMAMSGVYPCKAMEWLTSLQGVVSTPKPFYEFLQWQVMKSFQDTPLIQNNWKTKNYQVDGYQIVCEDDSNWAWDAAYNQPVRNDAVLLHGCRDGSLVAALEQFRPTFQKVPAAVRPQPTIGVRPASPARIPSFGQQPLTPNQPVEVVNPRNAHIVPIEQRQPAFTPQAPVAGNGLPSGPMPLLLFSNGRGRIEDRGIVAEVLPETAATSVQDRLERQIWEQNQAKALMPTVPMVQPAAPPAQTFQPIVTSVQHATQHRKPAKKAGRRKAQSRSPWSEERRQKQAEVMRARHASNKEAVTA